MIKTVTYLLIALSILVSAKEPREGQEPDAEYLSEQDRILDMIDAIV